MQQRLNNIHGSHIIEKLPGMGAVTIHYLLCIRAICLPIQVYCGNTSTSEYGTTYFLNRLHVLANL